MKKVLALILAAVMLLTVSGIPVLAETINTENLSKASARQPVNPVHHCAEGDYDTGDDTTDWSYVYFGNYPQTEVAGDALTTAIINANYDANGDAWVDGTEYRRIAKSDTNYMGYFGSREYRYFRWEPIKWRVLNNNGKTLFLVADKGIDCKAYNDKYCSVTWEDSTVRQWLNSKFYTTAFTSTERAAIVEKIVVNKDHSSYGTEGGNDTKDKIFLLSSDEVTDPSYGFCKKPVMSSRHRRMQTTDYAHVMGVDVPSPQLSNYEVFEQYGAINNCCWWLRSPGPSENTAAIVGFYGFVDWDYGHNVNDTSLGIVPALHINLSSNLWSIADKETSLEPENKNSIFPVHHCSHDETMDRTDWNYVYFGSFPQTEIVGDALTSAIIEAKYNITGDAWVDGTKYRRVKDTGTSDTYRYFKWERIKWRVINKNVSTSTLFLVADKEIDNKIFNMKSTSWENSSIRKWLNNNFYITAFSSNEQDAVVEQRVRNEANPKYGTEGGNDTQEKVYLLSIGEVTDPYYGFCSNPSMNSISRVMPISDYARVKGNVKGNTEWWLRSPGEHDSIAIVRNGYIDQKGYGASYRGIAVVPVLHVRMDSEFLYTEDDGTSGEGGSNINIEENIEVSLDKSEETLKTGETLKLTAKVSPSDFSDNEIKWSSSAPDVADVNVQGLVIAKHLGTAIITAEVKDLDGVSASCQITVERNEVKVSGILLHGNTSLTEGGTLRLMASVAPYNATNQALKWSSSDITVATVDSGSVTAIKPGKAIITATSTDGSNVSASCEITVEKKPEEAVKVSGITLDRSSSTLTEGDTLKLAAAVTPANATNQNLTWSSSDTTTATVDAAGLVTAIKEGTATITATSTDGSKISASCEITVEKKPEEAVKVSGITLDRSSSTLTERDTLKLAATVAPANATNQSLTWSSSDTTVATVDAAGLVTAIKEGTATITATSTDGSDISVSCVITVEKKPEETVKVSGITLDKSSSTLTEGDTLKLAAVVTPANATNQSLSWSSSDTTTATVDAAGLVTAVKTGTATITATSTDGSNISASCVITVEKKPEEAVKVSGITLDKSSSTLTEGDTLKLAATVAPANATNQRLTWSSSDTTTATVDATGLVTAVKEGTTTITATSTDGSNISASCVITVEKQKQSAEEIKIKTITLSQTAVVLQEGQTSKLTATVSPDNAKNKDLEWISSDTAVADIDTTGMITAKKAGTAVIIVLAKDGSGARASCGLTVEKKTEETPKPPENSTTFSYRKAIAKADVSFAEDSLYYTGAPVIPQITVSYDGQELIPDTDYTVTYENNINIGNAKATIEGIGAYSGKKFATFPIKGKIGATFEYKKGKYKILNASEVSYQGITSAKTKKVQIPQVVALGNKYFKVTKIADNALKNTKVTSVVIGNQVNSIGKSAMSGCKSLSQVVIGKNVSKVGKKAFYNCKKLKKITIHSSKLKAKNIGSNAYKGIYGKARIEVPSGKVKEYKKWLKSKGAGSKIKVVEK